jgi:cytochrome c biogenesis protein CcdA
MIKASRAAVRGPLIGAALGLVVGVAIDFLRLTAPVLILGRLALTPSLWVPLLGAVLGLAVGVMTVATPRPTGR